MSVDYDYSTDTTSDYGYQDFSSASTEAYQNSWDAYNAGDTGASDYWSSVSWDNWGTSTDLYVNGADAYGTDSPSTSEGYYGGYSADTTSGSDYSSTYDTGSSWNTTSYDTSSTDYSSTYDTSADYS